MSETVFSINRCRTEWALCASPAVTKAELAVVELLGPCLGTEA